MSFVRMFNKKKVASSRSLIDLRKEIMPFPSNRKPYKPVGQDEEDRPRRGRRWDPWWVAAIIFWLLVAGAAIAALVMSSLNTVNKTGFKALSPLAPSGGSILPIPCGNTSFGTENRKYEGETYLETACPETNNPCSENICGVDGFCETTSVTNGTCWFNAQCGEGQRCDLTSCGCVDAVAGVNVIVFDTNYTEGQDSIWNLTDPTSDCNYVDYGEWVDLQCNVVFVSVNSTNDGTFINFLFQLPVTGLDTQEGTGGFHLTPEDGVFEGETDEVIVSGACSITSPLIGTCVGYNENNIYAGMAIENINYVGTFELRYMKG